MFLYAEGRCWTVDHVRLMRYCKHLSVSISLAGAAFSVYQLGARHRSILIWLCIYIVAGTVVVYDSNAILKRQVQQ